MTLNSNWPKRRILAAAISAATMAGTMPVQAQTEKGIEEVTVIGQQFQDSLVNRLPIAPEKLPYSLDIIDASALRERGFINPLDILETLPNVVRRQTQLLPSSGQYLIRGLDSTVLTNNRPENNSRGSGRRDISQIERFEVLKGPTSILLGPVIPGGAVNQVTKSPKSEDFVELLARGGSYGTYRVEADANKGSLFGSDIWSGRITLAYEDQGTPQDEAGAETFVIRPVVEANFTDSTRLRASVSYADREAEPSSTFPVNVDGSVPAQIDEETYFGVAAAEMTGKDLYVDAELQHEFLDDLKLVVRGSHQDTDFDYQSSQGGWNYAGGRGFQPGDTSVYVYYSAGYRDTEVTYGDAQLVGNFDALGQSHDWVIGTSIQETKFDNYWAFGGVLGATDLSSYNTAVYAQPDFNLTLNPFRDQETELLSVYGETNLRPIDRLTIVAGVRFDDHEDTNLATNETVDNSDTTFRVGASWELSDGLNAYASYAESFIPQGGITRSGSSIEPETAVNWEVGLKGNLFDGRLALTAAAFTLTRNNVATADPDNMPGEPNYVVATGEQEHNGFELSANFAATEALNINFSYGYLDAEITEVINAGAGQDVGDPVYLVPTHTYSAFGSYTVQQGVLAGLRLGLGVRGISERPAPRFGIEYDGYTLVDGTLAYPISQKVDVQLNVHNLLNEDYRETVGFATGTPAAEHRFGNPRSAYVTFRARF